MKHHLFKYIIKYLLFSSQLTIIYGSILYPHIFYGKMGVWPILFVLYIWLYTNIMFELYEQNKKIENRTEHTFFSNYFGNFIKKYHPYFDEFFSLNTIFNDFFNFSKERKLESTSKSTEILYMIMSIIQILTFSVFYFLSIIMFILYNPILSILIENLLISIAELTELTKAQAMENDTSEKIAKELRAQLYKGTIPYINPFIVTGTSGLISIYLFKKKLFITAGNSLKNLLNNNKDVTMREEAARSMWSIIKHTTNHGIYITGATTTIMYIFLHKAPPEKVIEFVKLFNIHEVFNDYRKEINAVGLVPKMLQQISEANTIEELNQISKVYQELPENQRTNNIKLYENEMFKARCRIKQ